MSKPTRRYLPGFGWLLGCVDAAAGVLAFGGLFGAGPAGPRRKTGAAAGQRSAADVRRLAAAGLGRTEIARRTALPQDIVAMLLNLTGEEAAESAADGTFFRALQSRIAA
jgi:hypothetical protein